MFKPVSIQEPELIQKAKNFDDEIFNGHQQISLSELEAIAQQNGLYVIFNKGQIIAEAQILFESTDFCTLEHSNWAFIYGLGVKDEFRKEGLATQLLSSLEELAKLKGKTAIYLATRPENYSGIKLWSKAGYFAFSYKPKYFGSNENKDSRVLFKKRLTQLQLPFKTLIEDTELEDSKNEKELRLKFKKILKQHEEVRINIVQKEQSIKYHFYVQ